MMVPPESKGLFGGKQKSSRRPASSAIDKGTNSDHDTLDPTLPRNRQFKRASAPSSKVDSSSWTATPEEKQTSKDKIKVADEKRKRDDEVRVERERIERRDAAAQRIVNEFNESKSRTTSLVREHHKKVASGSAASDIDDPSKRPFDRERDLATRRITPEQRQKMMRQAAEMNSRFAPSSKGRFL